MPPTPDDQIHFLVNVQRLLTSLVASFGTGTLDFLLSSKIRYLQMRVYHFLSAEHALDDIAKGRLKISELDRLNDPFELWCSAQGDKSIRTILRNFKNGMAREFGVMCFCKQWHNPVLWSHYADRHKGICLGFDIDDTLVIPVRYVKKRPDLGPPFTQEKMQELLYTKYYDWRYEEELRGWTNLNERDPVTGFYFLPIDERLRLRVIIAGPLCDTPRADIEAARKNHKDVEVIKARLAFRTFRIVKNLEGFRS